MWLFELLGGCSLTWMPSGFLRTTTKRLLLGALQWRYPKLPIARPLGLGGNQRHPDFGSFLIRIINAVEGQVDVPKEVHTFRNEGT